MSSRHLTTIVFFAAFATALVIDPPPLLTLGANNISSSTAALNIVKPLNVSQPVNIPSQSFEAFNSSTPNPFPYEVHCDADYGDAMTFDPCKDAFEYIKNDPAVITMGNRATGPWGLDLPFRFTGCKCALF